MVDVYLSIAISIILFSLIAIFIIFRFIKNYLDNYFLKKWVYIETKLYQNIETGDVIIQKPEDMILIEHGDHKGQYIKATKENKLNYYDLIIEEICID
jgi:hypothetical protein